MKMKTLFYTLLGGVLTVVGVYAFAFCVWYISKYMSYAQLVLIFFFICGCIIGYYISKPEDSKDEYFDI